MDIVTLILILFLVLFALFGIPLPYIQIGKKLKKGYKWTRGFLGLLKEKLFISDDVVEHFNYYIEEFENFITSSYTPSFTHLYVEIRNKAKMSKMEEKHISDEIAKAERRYREIQATKRLNRKKVFKQTVRKFRDLVIDTANMGKNVVLLIKERNLDPQTIGADFSTRYNFAAKEFNIYVRHFRSFLDRTSCYHNLEIGHYQLLDLLLPEELTQP